jgi:hypothetical protein
MDILNWLYIKKQQLIRTTPDSTSDLVVLGADATFANRGDEYKSYAMPLKELVTQYDDAGLNGTSNDPIPLNDTTTLNGYTGRFVMDTDGLNAGDKALVTLANDKITALGTRVFISLGYSGSDGAPVAWYSNVQDGSMDVIVYNAHASQALSSQNVVITFEVLPH